MDKHSYNKMQKPKMIIFDYGHTLLCEPDLDFVRGEEALFKYVTSNKNNLTPKQVCDFSTKLFEDIGITRDLDLELHQWQFQKFLYEYMQLEFSISIPEIEKIFWDNASPGALMPNVEEMLNYIYTKGIRSAVISNIGWSGSALTERINRLLSQNKFEFIIASSEYMFRKPSSMIYELALRKAGLDAGDVWYCGDSIMNDVDGSAKAGIFPVWYQNKTIDNPWMGREEGMTPHCEHIHINDWKELIDILENIC